MLNIEKYGWLNELQTESNDSVALESLSAQINQGGPGLAFPTGFKPVNITVEQGCYYATLYVCCLDDGSELAQQVAVWLGTLGDNDHVHLTVLCLTQNVNLQYRLNLLAAFASTKATIEIHLDTLVMDSLAYFYLLADVVTPGSHGMLFVPSYNSQREEDVSRPWRAIHDFFCWLIEEAVTLGRLTAEEADTLNRGSHVTLPNTRF
jgi:hypothetical protein